MVELAISVTDARIETLNAHRLTGLISLDLNHCLHNSLVTINRHESLKKKGTRTAL